LWFIVSSFVRLVLFRLIASLADHLDGRRTKRTQEMKDGPVVDGPGWVGKHGGAQATWESCCQQGEQVGDLVIGWAVTSCPCHWCMEKEIARLLKPSLNKRTGSRKCCCRPVEGR
jgi:hypothetical protein